jgi:hypothetical protein
MVGDNGVAEVEEEGFEIMKFWIIDDRDAGSIVGFMNASRRAVMLR